VPPDYFFDKNPLKALPAETPIFLLLDFDGTLVPIQDDPAACVMAPKIRNELERLAGLPGCRVAILSGRSLADLKERTPAGNICLGGSHGLHISGCGLDFVHPAAEETETLVAKIRRSLAKEIEPIDGAWIENKGLTFALHYRRAGRTQAESARKAFRRAVERNPEKGRLAVLRGKKVLELLPGVSWDKGKAALFITDSLSRGSMPLYVGDDTTDETAFRELKARGITVRVGKSKRTAARYYLRSQREVLRLLSEVGMVAAGNP